MLIITAEELEKDFDEYLDLLQKEKKIYISKDGKVIAALQAPENPEKSEESK